MNGTINLHIVCVTERSTYRRIPLCIFYACLIRSHSLFSLALSLISYGVCASSSVFVFFWESRIRVRVDLERKKNKKREHSNNLQDCKTSDYLNGCNYF